MPWKNLLAAILDRLKIPLPEMGGASVCDSGQEFTDCSPSFSKVISQDETIPGRDELFDERKWKYWVTCYFQKSRCKNWENKDKSFHTQKCNLPLSHVLIESTPKEGCCLFVVPG